MARLTVAQLVDLRGQVAIVTGAGNGIGQGIALRLGEAGATNAGVLAAQMMALADPALAERLEAYKAKLAEKVEQAAARLAAGQP